MTVVLLRQLSLGVATAAAVGAALVTALGPGAVRAGLWLGLAGVVATAVGVGLRQRVVVICGLVALGAQHLLSVVGQQGIDARAAVLSGLLAVAVQAADRAIESGDEGFVEVAVAVRQGLALVGWGLGGWLAATAVLVAAGGAVDAVVARSVAVGLLVVVWLVVADALSTGGRA